MIAPDLSGVFYTYSLLAVYVIGMMSVVTSLSSDFFKELRDGLGRMIESLDEVSKVTGADIKHADILWKMANEPGSTPDDHKRYQEYCMGFCCERLRHREELFFAASKIHCRMPSKQIGPIMNQIRRESEWLAKNFDDIDKTHPNTSQDRGNQVRSRLQAIESFALDLTKKVDAFHRWFLLSFIFFVAILLANFTAAFLQPDTNSFLIICASSFFAIICFQYNAWKRLLSQ